MKTNLLIALTNIVENPIVDLVSHYKGSNRANSICDALENYVKDVFCHSVNSTDDITHSQYFSYLGNQNNPPDAIIQNGDAIEVKKIESLHSAIALNSSYPKDKLYRKDSRITESCRNCEDSDWIEKDIIYAIGISPKNTKKLKALWFIYGNCYAANSEIYQRVADKISQGIQEIPDVEFIETNELAKVKKVDLLGITDLRVRGMWHIENPIKVFKNVATVETRHDLTVHAIISTEKYATFPQEDKIKLESLQNDFFKITDIQIKSPNNPAKLLNAKLLTYAR